MMWTEAWFKRGCGIPRQFVQIPQDQEKLLSRQDAWDGGTPNVPCQVLEGLKGFHSRRLGPAATNNKSPLPPNTTQTTVVAQNGATTPREIGEEDGSESGTAIAWSTSPQRKPQTYHAVFHQDPTETLAAESPPSNPSFEPSSTGVGAIEPASKHRRDRFDVPEFPSSCASSEADLDVHLPGAITDVVKPFDPSRLATVLVPTPPSAQIPIIPCTFTEHATPAKDRELKRRKLMKQPKLGDHSTRQMERVIALAATASPVLSPLPVSESISSSIPASAPMVTTVFCQEENHGEALSVVSKEEHTEKSSVVTENRAVDGKPETHKAAFAALDANTATSQGLSSHSEEIPRNGPRSQVPFVVFKLAYPDFQSNLLDFLRGVICIKLFQPKKILPEFLYDDFVRVFASGFMEYISQLGDNKGALTAWQWYCENVHEAQYHQKVLKKENIQDVLEKYSTEVRKIMPELFSDQTTPGAAAGELGSKELAPEIPPASAPGAAVPCKEPEKSPTKGPGPLLDEKLSSRVAAPVSQRDRIIDGSLQSGNMSSRRVSILQDTPAELGNLPLNPIDISDDVSAMVQDGRGQGLLSQVRSKQDMAQETDKDGKMNDERPRQLRVTGRKHVRASPHDQPNPQPSSHRQLPLSWSKSSPEPATGYTFKTQPSFGGGSLEPIQSQLTKVGQRQVVTTTGTMASRTAQLGHAQGSQADSVTYISSGTRKQMENKYPPVVPPWSNELRTGLLPPSFGRASLDSRAQKTMRTQTPPLYKKPARASFDATIQSTQLDMASGSRSQTVHPDSIPETILKPRASSNITSIVHAKDSPPNFSNKAKRRRTDAESWSRFLLKERDKERAAQSSAPAK